jgi:hypothetical protein
MNAPGMQEAIDPAQAASSVPAAARRKMTIGLR